MNDILNYKEIIDISHEYIVRNEKSISSSLSNKENLYIENNSNRISRLYFSLMIISIIGIQLLGFFGTVNFYDQINYTQDPTNIYMNAFLVAVIPIISIVGVCYYLKPKRKRVLEKQKIKIEGIKYLLFQN